MVVTGRQCPSYWIAIAGQAYVAGNEIHGQSHILLDLHGLIIHDRIALAAAEHGEGRQRHNGECRNGHHQLDQGEAFLSSHVRGTLAQFHLSAPHSGATMLVMVTVGVRSPAVHWTVTVSRTCSRVACPTGIRGVSDTDLTIPSARGSRRTKMDMIG